MGADTGWWAGLARQARTFMRQPGPKVARQAGGRLTGDGHFPATRGIAPGLVSQGSDSQSMLHCTMNHALQVSDRLELDDVLGNLLYARREEDLGRLAHIAYWDVRRWARKAHLESLAERASDLIIRQPHPSRSAFLEKVDGVIHELEAIRLGLH